MKGNRRSRGQHAGPLAEADQSPLISCLMVSRGNLFPARLAIRCYCDQTYPNRELVIVSAQPDSPLAAYVAELGDPSIRYIQAPPQTLGELRNICAAEAHGALLCTWDDDDLCDPRRLELQLRACLEADAAAHFLNRLVIWWPARRKLAVTGRRAWENSMLVRREALPKYPPMPMREDTHVVSEIEKNYKVAVTDQAELYCYVVHSENICDDSHFEQIFEDADWIYSDYDAELVRLSGAFPMRWYADEMVAKSADTGHGISTNGGTGVRVVCAQETFRNEEIRVDAVHFKGCTFDGTQFLYIGGPVPVFEDCNISNVQIRLHGSAANTFNWLNQLKRDGILSDAM